MRWWCKQAWEKIKLNEKKFVGWLFSYIKVKNLLRWLVAAFFTYNKKAKKEKLHSRGFLL